MTSAAAFVEGGVQEANDDACSICLEDFCESNPSTVTTCKHEFHLQCLLEWCQRSSQCPMCWQSISLKDPSSQELLEAVERERVFRNVPSRNAAILHHPALGDFELQSEAVERERVFRNVPSRNAAILHHPALGDFELQSLPMGVNNVDIEERIIQHLTAAAAIGRTHHLGRREGPRARPSGHGRQHVLVFSTQPSAPTSGLVSPAAFPVGSPSSPLIADGDEPSQQLAHLQTWNASLPSRSSLMATNHQRVYSDDGGSIVHSSPPNQDGAGPSEFQSLSESLRSRLSSASMRYKESISKSTRGWKERLFCSSSTSEVRREFNSGIGCVSRLIERLETRENNRGGSTSASSNLANCSIAETNKGA